MGSILTLTGHGSLLKLRQLAEGYKMLHAGGDGSVMFRLMIVRMRPESGNSTYVTGRRPTRAREVQ